MYQEVLDGVASFEIHFNPMFSADVLAALTHAFDIWAHYVGLVVTACVVLVSPLVSSILVLLDVKPCLEPMLDTCIFLVLS